MKKLLSLLLVSTLIACGGNEDDVDDTTGRTTDPLIGVWTLDGGVDGTATFSVNANGSQALSWTGGELDGDVANGTWENTGSDFDALRQIYNLTQDFGDEDGVETYNGQVFEFSSDFNSFRDLGEVDDVWIRQ